MNFQEIFNTVFLGLASQKFKQSKRGRFCRYRDGACKCAAGWLIPDDQYNPAFDNRGPTKSSIGFWDLACDELCPPIFKGMTDDALQFVAELQSVHDNEDKPLNMKVRLIQVAANHALTVPEIPK